MVTSLDAIIVQRCYEIIREFDATLTDNECEYILWNETGYPCFFTNKTPIEHQVREQVKDYFA